MNSFIVIDTHECKLKDHFGVHENIKYLKVGRYNSYKESEPVLVIERKPWQIYIHQLKMVDGKEQKCRLTHNFP